MDGEEQLGQWTDGKDQMSSTGGQCHQYSEARPIQRRGLEMSRKEYEKWSERWKASGRKSWEGHYPGERLGKLNSHEFPLSRLVPQNVALKPAASPRPRSLLEMQNHRPHPRLWL